MSGLILKLRPNEEFMINGVVVQNGEKKTRLRVKTNGASILRLRDAMRPEEATTPEKRAYYVAQLAVAGELACEEAVQILRAALAELSGSFTGVTERVAIERASEELEKGSVYGVMRRLGEIARPAQALAAEAS
ncbi:MAG: flagellar biosynthesis repressor FlbT [Parvularculaceae bacterium]|nr:hypothetical protein [Amphiplicatus sp.]HRX38912.1 flagellar biosynthesis repressor FlbT [Parvularculaceae bacterium]